MISYVQELDLRREHELKLWSQEEWFWATVLGNLVIRVVVFLGPSLCSLIKSVTLAIWAEVLWDLDSLKNKHGVIRIVFGMVKVVKMICLGLLIFFELGAAITVTLLLCGILLYALLVVDIIVARAVITLLPDGVVQDDVVDTRFFIAYGTITSTISALFVLVKSVRLSGSFIVNYTMNDILRASLISHLISSIKTLEQSNTLSAKPSTYTSQRNICGIIEVRQYITENIGDSDDKNTNNESSCADDAYPDASDDAMIIRQVMILCQVMMRLLEKLLLLKMKFLSQF